MAERARRPFWIHQFADYLIGAALIGLIIQDPEPMVPALVGVVIVINAAVARGPLGAFSRIGRRTHRSMDLAMMALMLFGAVQPWFAESSMGRVALVLLLVPFVSSWYYADWDDRAERRQRRAAAGSDRSEVIGRSAGRVAGSGWKSLKRVVNDRGSNKPGE